jgi:putative hydrolase of the HAD superfamily
VRNERSVVFLDVGGPIYDDRVYADALRVGLRAGGADVPDADFDREYERCRRAQAGFTGPLARRFGVDVAVLERAAAATWRYPPEAMHADVLPSLRRVAAGFAIGVLANQPAATRAALERDGVAPFVQHWVLSGDLGLAKPDPRLFAHAIDVAGRAPERVAYVGNRLDNDVRPARAAGMRTVWILRGEAPAAPTAGQRAEADVVIRSLAELPGALERIGLSAVP